MKVIARSTTIVRHVHLVGTDVLRDATRLVSDDVGRPDRVEQLGLSVVDVTHDGDDRRTRAQCVLVLASNLGVEVDVERLEQLAVLVLGADDLNVVAELSCQQRKVSSSSDWVAVAISPRVNSTCTNDAGFGVDALGEVGQRRTTRQANDLALTAGNLHAADRRCLQVVELLTPLLARLAATLLATAATEGTSRLTTATAGATEKPPGRPRTTGRTAGCTARPPPGPPPGRPP